MIYLDEEIMQKNTHDTFLLLKYCLR